MSKSIKQLTPEEKKRLNHLIIGVTITGAFAMLGAILQNPYVFALQGIGLLITFVSLFRMLVITRLKKD